MPSIQQQHAPFFTVTHAHEGGGPRTGCLQTTHGAAETPCFLPIATQGSLRAMSFQQAEACGTRIIMANAWHIFRNTGPEVLEKLGGAHGFMKWDGILFTDSGGYQVFSLKDTSTINDNGVAFDVDAEMLTPAKAIEIQKHLGADVMFVLDDCAPYPCTRKRAEEAVRRTTLWARECMAAHKDTLKRYAQSQAPYGIIQGGARARLRMRSAQEVAELNFDGYGIGGLSIGMPRSEIREMTALTCEMLPSDKPRHLLGVGLPGQVLEGIADGVDTFDCVLPIRKAQRGIAYTRFGEVRYKNPQPAAFKDQPLEAGCMCSTCTSYSREQLRLLFQTDTPMAGQLAAIHNIWLYHKLLEGARRAIVAGQFSSYLKEFLADWGSGEENAVELSRSRIK
jgi:queuine tRNA-ribosyltransferase